MVPPHFTLVTNFILAGGYPTQHQTVRNGLVLRPMGIKKGVDFTNQRPVIFDLLSIVL